METTKKEIIQRLFDKGQITFTEALLLAESVLAAPTSPLEIFDSMEEVFNNSQGKPYVVRYNDPLKTNIT